MEITDVVQLVNKDNFLEYVIRDLDPVADRFSSFGISMVKENIGDPVKAGVEVEPWIVEIMTGLTKDASNWRYAASDGERKTREFLMEQRNERGGVKISADDIIFYSGSADAIAETNSRLMANGVLLVPTPGYPTHSSFQAEHIGRKAVFYKLDPSNKWLPDMNDMEQKIIENKSAVKGIVVINPNNPTGSVLPKGIIKEIVELCRKYRILPIFDECYINLVYNSAVSAHLGDVIGDYAGMAMRTISKDFPAPAIRMGWVELYNKDKYPNFRGYFGRLLSAKRLHVGANTIAELSIPLVYGDKRFKTHLEKWNKQLEEGAKIRVSYLKQIKGASVITPDGAFYIAAKFDDGVLNSRQSLPVMECRDKAGAQNYLKELLAKEPDMAPDKRLIYYLMVNGIFITPLSGFGSGYNGFRVTTLNPDMENVRQTYAKLVKLTNRYIDSAK